MATGEAVVPVDFIRFRGKPLRLAVLTLAQQQELAQYLRFLYMEEAKREAEGLPSDLWRYAWDRAKARADNIYPGREEHRLAYYTPEGATYALYLSASVHQPAFSLDDAMAVLEECGEEARAKVDNAVGYRPSKSTGKPKAIPIDEIIHVLANEPFGYSPSEIKALSLDEVALVTNRPLDDPEFSQTDQSAFIANYLEKLEKQKLGIWGEDSIWKQ